MVGCTDANPHAHIVAAALARHPAPLRRRRDGRRERPHGRHQKARHGQSLRRPGSPRRPRAGARTRPGSRRVRRRRRSPPPHLPQRARRQRRPAGPRTALGRRHGRPGLEAAEPPPQEARHQPFRRHVDHREAAGRRPRRDVVPRALRPVRGALRAEQGRGKGEGCPASERHSRGRHRGIPLPHPGHGQARRPGEGDDSRPGRRPGLPGEIRGHRQRRPYRRRSAHLHQGRHDRHHARQRAARLRRHESRTRRLAGEIQRNGPQRGPRGRTTADRRP